MLEKELLETGEIQKTEKNYDLHRVEGFNPWNHLEPMKNMSTREDIFDPDNNGKMKTVIRIDALLYWFRLRYPEGSILVEEILKNEEDTFYFKASVYANRNDSMPIATGQARRVSCENEEFPAYETAETLAIRTALRYAGFGPEIYAKDGSVATIDEQGENHNKTKQDGLSLLRSRMATNEPEPKCSSEPQNSVLRDETPIDKENCEIVSKDPQTGIDALLGAMADVEIGENAIDTAEDGAVEKKATRKRTPKKATEKTPAKKESVQEKIVEEEKIDILAELEEIEKRNLEETIELTKEEAGDMFIEFSTEDVPVALKKLIGKPLNKISTNNLDYLIKNCENRLSEKTIIAIKTYLS